jgi:hypothetical protein
MASFVFFTSSTVPSEREFNASWIAASMGWKEGGSKREDGTGVSRGETSGPSSLRFERA